MSKGVIVDTNVLLRFLLQDIPEQYDQAKKLFSEAKLKKVSVFIPEIVIFEIVFGLTNYYSLNREEIVDKVKSLLSTIYIEVESKRLFQEACILYPTNSGLSFVDCFLLAKVRIEGLNLFTFDKKLAKIV